MAKKTDSFVVRWRASIEALIQLAFKMIIYSSLSIICYLQVIDALVFLEQNNNTLTYLMVRLSHVQSQIVKIGSS